MSKVPYRPTHTGSARVQAAKSRSATTTRPPSHHRQAGAAVALESSSRIPSNRLVRRARRPLILDGGRRALALRQEGEGAIEVLVQKASGVEGWRPLERVLTPAQLRSWLLDGFGSSLSGK